MKKLFVLVLLISMAVISFFVFKPEQQLPFGAPEGEAESSLPPGLERFPEILNWKRPEGPLKVGLQAGHWKNNELPDEFRRLREQGGGTSNGKTPEWQVVLRIAEETKKLLELEGVVVDILPATVPEGYWADAFISIHADGSTNSSASGFKVAAPWRDFTGKAGELVSIIEEEYGQATGLALDPNITRNMRGYYAFSWWRYDHTVHPMTPSVILETGFLTNTSDAKILMNTPEVPAKAISASLLRFLNSAD